MQHVIAAYILVDCFQQIFPYLIINENTLTVEKTDVSFNYIFMLLKVKVTNKATICSSINIIFIIWQNENCSNLYGVLENIFFLFF